MITSWQILSKVLQTHDNSIIEDNFLTEEYFPGYEEPYNFIQDHVKAYGNVPDTATFLAKFPDMDLVEVTESDKYLIKTIREEYLYTQSVPVLQKYAEILKSDSNAAAEYLSGQLATLQPDYGLGGTNIIQQANERYTQFLERKNNPDKWFFESGFKELDDIIGGIQREEELFVILARTNMGKSWILEKIVSHIWGLGFNVGYVSPEMSANSIGFRFDTLHQHYANKGLMMGGSDINEEEYANYVEGLKEKQNCFMVATPSDFGNCINITKLRQWIKQYKLDLIAIDGITYLSDERGKKNDNKTTSLTDISEDLMALSVELKVPVLVVVQANRNGVVDKDTDDTPELESMRDSDGIAHNASKVISIRQKRDTNAVILEVKKQRTGPVGGKIMYTWDINKGVFFNIPVDDSTPQEKTRKKSAEKPQHKEDVF